MFKVILYGFLVAFCKGLLDTTTYFGENNNWLSEKRTIKEQETLPGTTLISKANKTVAVEKHIELSRAKDSRSLNSLSPGEEYLLSVVTLEDAKDSQFGNLPHLKKFLQQGNIDFGTDSKPENSKRPEEPIEIDTNRDDSSLKHSIPPRLLNMMEAFSNLQKADVVVQVTDNKPTGFLDSLTSNPLNFILTAVIPLSLLLAAVVPILTNLLMTGLYIPPITSIATGVKGRSLDDANSTEYFVPILESIASFGAKTFEDVTKENAEEAKVRFVKEALEMITSFVNQKWFSLFGGVSKMSNICTQNNCTSSLNTN